MTSACVLLIEDDPHVCERLELLIEAAGLRVYSVSAAQDARGALAAVLFPIVIIDRMLGDEEGIALCQQARKLSEPHRTYIVLLSGGDSEGSVPGADCYWNRDSSDEELLDHLRTAIRSIRLHAK